MEKTRLKATRLLKGFTQEQVADFLCMDVSNYSRRENGEVYIKIEHWEKLAKVLDVPLSEIYEPDERQSNTCSDNASGNFIGTNFGPNNIYTILEVLLETQKKYIAKLEEEIQELKKKTK